MRTEAKFATEDYYVGYHISGLYIFTQQKDTTNILQGEHFPPVTSRRENF